MKSNTITVTSSENNGDVVLTMKRKKFPWWIFLFLLPLILLIPIKRDINIQYAQQGSDIAVAKAAATVNYPVTSTFGGKRHGFGIGDVFKKRERERNEYMPKFFHGNDNMLKEL